MLWSGRIELRLYIMFDKSNRYILGSLLLTAYCSRLTRMGDESYRYIHFTIFPRFARSSLASFLYLQLKK